MTKKRVAEFPWRSAKVTRPSAMRRGAACRGGLGRVDYFERKIEIVREGVGRAHGQNGQRGGRVGEDLSDVVDGAVAAAGEDGVATGVDRAAGFFDGVMGRFSGNQIGFHGSVSKHGERGFQFPLALLAAAGFRVVEQRGLAHSGRTWIVPEAFRMFGWSRWSLWSRIART